MNATLRDRLIRAEQQFLLAVASNDEGTLKVFSQERSQLAHDIEGVEAAGQLDDDTALLLSQVSRAIENIANCMLECGAISQEAQTCNEFIQDIPSDGLSSTASLHPHAIAPCHLLFSDPSSSMTPSILGQQKFLDSFAYRWLLQNIHNPYPTSVQTRIISDVSSTSTTQVEFWFREVRDAIGWSKLTHDFFAGSVSATVAAARRVYLERDRNISFDIVFAFTAVKAFAETLFSEHPSLEGKDVKIAMDQDHHTGPFPDESGIDPEGIPVPPQANLPAPLDPFSDLSDSDDSEEEDTTPPPPIAGYKRSLAEELLTSHECDLERPQKRSRSGPVNCTPSDELECPPTLGPSSEKTIPSNTATFILPSTSPQVSSPPPESLPSSIPLRMENASFNDDTPEYAVSSPRTQVPMHGVRKRRLSQSDALVHSKRQCRFISPPTGHPTVKPLSSSHSYPDLSLPQSRPSDLDEPTLPVLVKPDAPVNFGVFDWNSMSDPSVATASLISQPAIAYVPSADLKSQVLEPSDYGHDGETRSHSFVDVGSLEDLSSSLQFPMPAVFPDPSGFTALDSSSLPLQDLDWSSITEFIDTISPSSTQSSSQSASSNVPATPLGSSHESFFLSQSCDSTKQPSSVLDPSIPPSAFLPFDSGAFSEDMGNMWSFLRDGS